MITEELTHLNRVNIKSVGVVQGQMKEYVVINRTRMGWPFLISLLEPKSNSSGGETSYKMEPCIR